MANGQHESDRTEDDLIVEFYQALDACVARFRSKNAAARWIGISPATLTRASPGWINENSVKGRPARPQVRTLHTVLSIADDRLRAAATALLALRPSESNGADFEARQMATADFDYQSASLHFAAVGQRTLFNAASNAEISASDLELMAALELLTSFTNAHYCLAVRETARIGMLPRHPFGLAPEYPDRPYHYRGAQNPIYNSDATTSRVRSILDSVDLYDPVGELYAGCRVVSYTSPSWPLLRLIEFDVEPTVELPSEQRIYSLQSQALEQELVVLMAARSLIACAAASPELQSRRLHILCRAIEKACLDNLPFTGRAFLEAYRWLFENGDPLTRGRLASIFVVGRSDRPGAQRHYFVNWLNTVGDMCRIEGFEGPTMNPVPIDMSSI